jgi:hypothetical protein
MLSTLLTTYLLEDKYILLRFIIKKYLQVRNQVNAFSNYTVNDPSFVNQKINSVMKVYATNGTLIKTSSSADGFIVKNWFAASCNYDN